MPHVVVESWPSSCPIVRAGSRLRHDRTGGRGRERDSLPAQAPGVLSYRCCCTLQEELDSGFQQFVQRKGTRYERAKHDHGMLTMQVHPLP